MIVNEILVGIQKELIIGLIVLIIGLIVLFLALRAIKKSKASSQWLTTKGEITKSGTTKDMNIERGYSVYNADIEYKYIVNGKEYTSSRIYFGSSISMTGKEEKSNLLARKYPLLRKVTVYYNPENEKESVLETETQSELYWGIAISIIVIAFGIFYCLK
ncbi:MAG: DUF3592 domain-containing protein [Bacteroidales bacterium]